MRIRLVILIIAFIAVVIGCDEDGVGPQPSIPGYIWTVHNGVSESDPDRPPLIEILKYAANDGSWEPRIEAYFYGWGYDIAYGDGRLWLACLKIEVGGNGETSSYGIWEREGGFFETQKIEGLTWDGEYLWGSLDSDFYRFDADTYEYELMFTFGDGTKSFNGLAWDGEYLWGLADGEAIKIDRETGSRVRSVTCPGGFNTGLAWGPKYLWVNEDNGGSYDNIYIYRFSPVDGTVYSVFDTGSSMLFSAGGLAYEPEEGNGG